MRTPLAWLNLAHNKTRTVLAVAGVVFAVVLIFMQLGFLGSAETSASKTYNAMRFDILLRSPRYLHLVQSRTIPLGRLYQAASVPGVRSVCPFYVASDRWRNPVDGTRRAILVLGVRPEDPVFAVEELKAKVGLLTSAEFALVDRQSRREFGPQDGRRFGEADVGVTAEVGQREVRIVGHFALGTGFTADGSVLLSDEGFRRVCSYYPRGEANLGLVTLDQGARLDAVVARLKEALPEDVEVVPRTEVIRREVDRWVNETAIGVVFQFGVVVAMIVGAAIVYQVLSSDVSSHLAEYATLKAIGYSGRFLAGVVLQQAIALAALGFLPALLIAEGLYALTRSMASLPIEMSFGRVVFVLALSVAMCMLSGLGALRKLRTADPADLF